MLTAGTEMALFLVYLRDIDDNAEIRARLLEAHMAHIDPFREIINGWRAG